MSFLNFVEKYVGFKRKKKESKCFCNMPDYA